MDIPNILQGDVHLPLTEHMVVAEALSLANTLYHTALDVTDFKESQTYKTPDGQLVLEVLDKTTGEVKIHFVNKAKANTVATPAMKSLWNPLINATEKLPWLVAPVQLACAREIAFLDHGLVGDGVYPIKGDSTMMWRLAQLLNNHNVLGRWFAGSFADLSTNDFELVFKGHSLEAPMEYLVDFSPMIAIIKINAGNRQGYLCLKS